MDGTVELRELASLLRVGSDAARKIAAIRHRDRTAIHALADQALAMARSLETIASPESGDNAAKRHS